MKRSSAAVLGSMDPDQIITLPRHQVALHHFIVLDDPPRELSHGSFDLILKANVDEYVQI